MFRRALFCAATLIACGLAAPTFSAPASIPSAVLPSSLPVDLSSAFPTQPVLASDGSVIPAATIVSDAGQIANATMGAAAAVPGAALAADSVIPFSGTAPLDASGLGGARGGSNVTFNGAVTVQDLSAINTGNAISAASVSTGAVSIGSNAFSGFNGVGNFLMNSGNQNNIQGSLSINVVIPSALPAH